MAGKYALYLPYKVLDSLSSGNVTDSQFREFIMGLAEYDKTGAFPTSQTAGFNMMYELLKSDLDFAKAKYEDIVEERRKAGQQGGAPKGNKNAVKNHGGGAPEGNQNAVGNRGGGAPPGNRNAKKEAPEQEPELEKQTQTQANQPKQAKQADNSSQYSVNRNSSSGEVVSQPPLETTTTLFITICKSMGYSIGRRRAQEILNTGINPSWLSGAFTYPEYIAEYIQKVYPDKPLHEKRNLFMALLIEDDKKDDFPDWRKTCEAESIAQEERHREEEAARERRRKLDKARAAVPTNCPVCNAVLNYERRCPNKHGVYRFQEDELEYKFLDTTKDDGNSLTAEFQKRMMNIQSSKHGKTGATA